MHTPRNIQSPYTATDFWTQWSSTAPRIAMMIKVTSRADFGSTVLGFTTNTRNMTLPGHSGVTFKASPAITPTIVEQGLDEASNLELTGVYNDDSFTHIQVMAGMWNFAAVEVFSVCWDNVDLGELVHFSGNVGEFKDYQTYFTAEGRGKIGRLSNEVNYATSRLCRVKKFRDAQCGHTASTVTIDATTYNIVETDITIDGSFTALDNYISVNTADFAGNVPPENFYRNGEITCTSGDNVGISREIAYNAAASGGVMNIYLKRPFPYGLVDPDAFTLTAGCTRTLEDCMKFSNIVNRRGEDWIPGLEAANRLPQ